MSYSDEVRGHQILQRVAAQALADHEYRRRLIDDPKTVLREEGLEVPDEIEIVIHENTGETLNLVLPVALPEGELDIDETNVTVLFTTHF